jgi:alpha-D-ribose 1-methylphosphonate 5-triphosphate synthase subunit PhnI
MTQDQSQRVDAEIAKLIAETSQINSQIEVHVAKVLAETSKLNAETAKLATERQWYPAFIGAGFTAAVAGLTATLIKLFI